MKNFKKRIFITNVCERVKVFPLCSISFLKLKSNYREFHELLEYVIDYRYVYSYNHDKFEIQMEIIFVRARGGDILHIYV